MITFVSHFEGSQKLEMCVFNLYKYATCSHCGIELESYCPKAFWSAGMTGVLTICLPLQLVNMLRGLEVNVWAGIKSHCRYCSDQRKLPLPIMTPTYEWHNLCSGSSGQLWAYAFVPALEKTINELLSIPITFEDKLLRSTCQHSNIQPLHRHRQQELGLRFPQRMEMAPLQRLVTKLPWRNPGIWQSQAHMHLSMEGAHFALNLRFGVTELDLQRLYNLYLADVHMDLIWDKFEPRGMSIWEFVHLLALSIGCPRGHHLWLKTTNDMLRELQDLLHDPLVPVNKDTELELLGDGSPMCRKMRSQQLELATQRTMEVE